MGHGVGGRGHRPSLRGPPRAFGACQGAKRPRERGVPQAWSRPRGPRAGLRASGLSRGLWRSFQGPLGAQKRWGIVSVPLRGNWHVSPFGRAGSPGAFGGNVRVPLLARKTGWRHCWQERRAGATAGKKDGLAPQLARKTGLAQAPLIDCPPELMARLINSHERAWSRAGLEPSGPGAERAWSRAARSSRRHGPARPASRGTPTPAALVSLGHAVEALDPPLGPRP
jgi:hypothetical protein